MVAMRGRGAPRKLSLALDSVECGLGMRGFKWSQEMQSRVKWRKMEVA